MRRVLVTGGGGFLGTNLVDYILTKERDIEVIATSSLNNRDVRNRQYLTEKYPDRCTFITLDLADKNSVEDLFDLYQPTHVIHLAARAGYSASEDEITRANVQATRNLMEEAVSHNAESFYYQSTGLVYGQFSGDSPIVDPSVDIHPEGAYARTKVDGERIVQDFITPGMNKTIGRTCNIYGAWDKSPALIPNIIRGMLKNEPITLNGNGMQKKQFIHVSDACEAVWKIATEGEDNTIYNISPEGASEIIYVGREIARSLQRPESILSISGDNTGKNSAIMDSSPLREMIPNWPRVNLQQGIEATARWYQAEAQKELIREGRVMPEYSFGRRR